SHNVVERLQSRGISAINNSGSLAGELSFGAEVSQHRNELRPFWRGHVETRRWREDKTIGGNNVDFPGRNVLLAQSSQHFFTLRGLADIGQSPQSNGRSGLDCAYRSRERKLFG